MTLLVSEDGASVVNDDDLSGSPAVRITGDGVRFLNRGSIVSTSSGVAAVEISGFGGTFTNDADGRIAGSGADKFALQGSIGKDVLIDAGLIDGRVSLGASGDSFVSRRDAFGDGRVDLGTGNDVYRQDSGGGALRPVSGGAGYDRIVLTGPSEVSVAAGRTSGFEQLEVGAGSTWDLRGFSGYEKVIVSGGASASFFDSANPDADIVFAAVRQGVSQTVVVGAGAAFRSVTTTEQTDRVEVTGGGQVLGNIMLLGGNDEFRFSHSGGAPPGLGGSVDAGEGFDRIHFQVGDGRTLSLMRMANFEWLSAGSSSSPPIDLRLWFGTGLQRIDKGVGRLYLFDCNSPAAVVTLLEGTLVVWKGTLGQLGVALEGGDEAATADPDFAIAIYNDGKVVGDVFLSLGHDVFEGPLGQVGGAIHGYAGNDRLIGGIGPDEIIGGFGHDRLDGGQGADIMTGGAGNDVYVVDHNTDKVIEAGASGTDTVESAIAFRLPVHFEKLILTGSFGYDGTGNAGANTLTGNPGRNFLNGGSGNDLIDGGAGDDQLMGYLGRDRLTGGAGDDGFYFNVATGVANADRILDFSAADDSLHLLRPVFSKAGANGMLPASAFHQGASAADAGDRILYDAATGNIFYDPDGTGAAAAQLFAIVDAGTPLTHADFVIYG